MTEMHMVAAILMGISLAACAGLRAFMPLFAVGLAARGHFFPVQPWFAWVGSDEAVIMFGVATLVELVADKVPVLDHALDVFHTVARPIAGALVAMSAFYQVSPTYAAALGIIVGAPIAAGFHFAKAGTRVASTHLTAGLGNPVLSIVEDAAAVTGTVLALFAPVVAALAIGLTAFFAFRWVRDFRGRVAGVVPPRFRSRV
jgi:uncharacterized membrane protein